MRLIPVLCSTQMGSFNLLVAEIALAANVRAGDRDSCPKAERIE